jgi:predicted permease
LGASRGRIARQLLTESLVLSLGGGIVGLALALVTSGALTLILPPDLLRLSDVGVDLRVLAFTGLLALGTGLVFGVLPALRISKAETQAALKGEERTVAGRRGGRRLSGAIVVLEIAVGVVVVIGAGLVARSLWRLANVNPGFDAANMLTAVVTPNESLCEERARCIAFYDELLNEIRALPGVEAAAAVNPLPLSGSTRGAALELEGHPVLPGSSAPSLWTTIVTPGYLEAMRIPILRGRSFAATDQQASGDVVLVSRATAERWWPGEDPIGKRLRYVSQENRWRTVIGVTADTRQAALAGDPDWIEGDIYLPYAQFPEARMAVVARTAGEPIEMAAALRSIVAGLRDDVPVTEVRTMEEVVSASLIAPRSTMWLLSAFAALALLLSATGVYAVASYAVAQRTRELGVRIALGAQRRDILGGVIGRSLALGGIGLALGVAAALGATRALGSLLYEVPATDVITFASMPLLLLAVMVVASYLPARRASRVDPTVALRGE